MTVLKSRRVVLPYGERPAAVVIEDGRIAAIASYDTAGEDVEAILPGLVDTHVHVNEPGRTEWEGFATATRAAAAGGVTTIVDMPLNSLPPTVSAEALATKRAAASGQCTVDVGFWGGAVPGNAGELPALHDAGVFGFKCFLVDSGVPEFPPLDRAGLDAALAAVDALFIVHAEDPGELHPAEPSRDYADFLASRPDAAEVTAVGTAIDAASRANARVHILHLSSARVLPLLRAAKDRGVRVTAETCPHYLTLEAEHVPAGATQYKCCPPIRGHANREALWSGLADGTIDFIVSDHSPCTPELKRPDTGDFAAAWGGIASLQLGLPIVWTEARRRGHTLADVATWMAARPAELAGLAGPAGPAALAGSAGLAGLAGPAALAGSSGLAGLAGPAALAGSAGLAGLAGPDALAGPAGSAALAGPTGRAGPRGKGRIAVGADADLVVFDPDATFTVDPTRLEHRHPVTPYAGRELRGVVRQTWLRGVPVDGEPRGRLLTREP